MLGNKKLRDVVAVVKLLGMEYCGTFGVGDGVGDDVGGGIVVITGII